MKRIELYRKAMIESIKNSEMWLKEARIIAKKGSKGHAQALTIFASEELGKAVMCWFVVKGVFPLNYWEIDFRSPRSMFHKHSLKIATDFALGQVLDDEVPDDMQEEVPDSWTGKPIEFRKLLAKIGAAVSRDH